MKLAFVFNVFGAVIINNLNKNLELSLDDKRVKMCVECGKRIKLETVNAPTKYCKICAKKIKGEQLKPSKIITPKNVINLMDALKQSVVASKKSPQKKSTKLKNKKSL